jgi:hypothetical protein
MSTHYALETIWHIMYSAMLESNFYKTDLLVFLGLSLFNT